MLGEWGLPAERVAAWQMAVAELATNVCRHAYPAGQRGLLALALVWDGAGLSIDVIDEGEPFDPGGVPLPPDPDPADPATWPEGGMGLMLARSAGDELRYRSEHGRNVLTLFTSLPRA